MLFPKKHSVVLLKGEYSMAQATVGASMTKSSLARFEAVVVLIAGIAAIFVSFFAALAYYLPLWARAEAPAWILAAQSIFVDALTFDDAVNVYRTYGRVFVFIALAFVIGWTALRARRGNILQGSENLGWELARGGTLALALGTFADFWVGSALLGNLSPILFSLLTVGGGAISLVGMLILAWTWVRNNKAPRWMAYLWGGVVVLAVVLTVSVFRHIPSGYMLAIGVAWAVMGVAWLRERGNASVSIEV